VGTVCLCGIGKPKDYAAGVLTLPGDGAAVCTGGSYWHPELIAGTIAALWDQQPKGSSGSRRSSGGTYDYAHSFRTTAAFVTRAAALA
jgi:hypothetical protein